jgi:hypothetical protein
VIAIVAKRKPDRSRPSALRVLARVRWAANSEQMRRGRLSGEAATIATGHRPLLLSARTQFELGGECRFDPAAIE